MVSAVLKTADLTRAELHAVLDALQVPQDEATSLRIWLEAPDGWALDYWRGTAATVNWYRWAQKPAAVTGHQCVARAWAGRIFAPSDELRWRVIESLGERCCRVVFLGNSDWLADQLTPRPEIIQQLSPRTERYFLWGQRTEISDGDWVELRIPHRFCYPVAGSGKGVRAVVELWCDRAGELHFARLCHLEPFEEGA